MNKERYHSDPKYRARIKKIVKKYQSTPKGKETWKRALDKLRAKDPLYLSRYLKAKREKAKKQGMCIRCFKKPKLPDKTICQSCDRYEKKKRRAYKKSHR